VNTFIYVLMVFAFTIIQTTLLNLFLPFYISPNLLAVLVVYVAMTRGFREGLLYILFASYMFSLNTSEGPFVIAIFFIIIYAVARYVSLNFYTNDLKYLFLSIVLPVGIGKLLVLFWIDLGNFLFFMEHLFYLISETAITGVVGMAIFKLFNWIDTKTGLIDLESVVEK
jgi:hypothetical protein